MRTFNTSGFRLGWLLGRVPPHVLSATLIAKGTFRLERGGPATRIPFEEQLHLSGDILEGERRRYPSDFVPWKPRADVLLVGSAHAPAGTPVRELRATLGVGPWSKSARLQADTAFARAPLDPLFGPRPNGGPLPGTYDAAWLRAHWPWFPPDFDWSFFSSAPEDQRLPEFLKGDETISLEHVRPDTARFESALPGIRPRWFVESKEEFAEVPLKLDTLWIDGEAGKLIVIWRGVMPARTKILSEVSAFSVVAEALSAPRPIQEHRADLARLRAEKPAPTPPLKPVVVPPVAPIDPSWVAEFEAGFERMKRDLDAEEAEAAGRLSPLAALTTVSSTAPEPPANLSAADQALWREAEAFPPEIEAQTPTPPSVRVPPPRMSREAIEARVAVRGSFAGEDLSGANLSNLDLSGIDFRGAVLRGASLRGARLVQADLSEARLSRADVGNACLDGCRLTGADLERCAFPGSSLRGAILDRADLSESRLEGADLSDASCVGATFHKAHLEKAKLEKANLDRSDLSGAFLAGATARNASLRGAALDGVSASGADLEGANVEGLKAGPGAGLRGAILRGCRGGGTVWDEASAEGVDFTAAVLPGANFDSANLAGARFDGADLRRARLDRAILRQASFAKANLFRATLEDADLREAVFDEASLFEAETWGTIRDGARFRDANLGRSNLAHP